MEDTEKTEETPVEEEKAEAEAAAVEAEINGTEEVETGAETEAAA